MKKQETTNGKKIRIKKQIEKILRFNMLFAALQNAQMHILCNSDKKHILKKLFL